ncbi:MAG: DUF4238 domain-containing protein [Clostridium sp.]|uniref:DUF4238 domain-containing protein n=1 Tax=Clostridium sp. TaxID=1506 RepID=UPI002A91F490|nr:DUF4238 domain-containing protein [Clostridium sp.]MDY6228037.1 DUF4238 domain-containing protein [Clostridium sp.]
MIRINKTKKEHYVPRFYLRRFALTEASNSANDKKSKFIVYDKENKKSYLSSVYDCACENYFYDLDNPKDKDNKKIVEEWFAEIEESFSKILSRLINICIQKENLYGALITNKNERYELSYYLVMQLLRTKKFRQIGKNFYGPILKTRLRCFNEYSKMYLNQEDTVDINKIEINYKNIHLKTLFDNNIINLMIDFIVNSYWTFGYNATKVPFITSDNPVCRIPYLNEINSKLNMSSFIGPYFQMYFPLSPQVVLCIYREESILYKKVGKEFNNRLVNMDKEKLIDSINLYQVIMANQKIFINPNNEELLMKYCSNSMLLQQNCFF